MSRTLHCDQGCHIRHHQQALNVVLSITEELPSVVQGNGCLPRAKGTSFECNKCCLLKNLMLQALITALTRVK